jgi:hypothetical protein
VLFLRTPRPSASVGVVEDVSSRSLVARSTSLFHFDVRTSGQLWSVDVLKPEGQRLVTKELWA